MNSLKINLSFLIFSLPRYIHYRVNAIWVVVIMMVVEIFSSMNFNIDLLIYTFTYPNQ